MMCDMPLTMQLAGRGGDAVLRPFLPPKNSQCQCGFYVAWSVAVAKERPTRTRILVFPRYPSTRNTREKTAASGETWVNWSIQFTGGWRELPSLVTTFESGRGRMEAICINTRPASGEKMRDARCEMRERTNCMMRSLPTASRRRKNENMTRRGETVGISK